MPGVHFAEVQARITLADVLGLLGFVLANPLGVRTSQIHLWSIIRSHR